MKTNKTVFIIASIILLFALYYKKQQTDSKELIEGFKSSPVNIIVFVVLLVVIVVGLHFGTKSLSW